MDSSSLESHRFSIDRIGDEWPTSGYASFPDSQIGRWKQSVTTIDDDLGNNTNKG